ncbi:hypothetical protein V7152_13085 [Neobacillus drentensis]|uniref:hypothetical protein n=1 Tax=Neobacillus drentensis TaxID=220684 RepID=UPI002FFDBB79
MTVLIGKKFKNGVLITGDKRITYEATDSFNDDTKKVIKLNEKIILAYAGKKNIVDAVIDALKEFATKNDSLEVVSSKSKELFSIALKLFKETYPNMAYSTVYILAGLNDENNEEPIVNYFSSDDFFQTSIPLGLLFYKTYPEEEMEKLESILGDQVDFSQNNIEYYVEQFSSIIRNMKSAKIGNTTYSIFLSKEGLYEFESDENGEIQIIQI